MLVRYIFALVAAIFISLGLLRITGGHARHGTHGRIWLSMGVVFAAISGWLFYQS